MKKYPTAKSLRKDARWFAWFTVVFSIAALGEIGFILYGKERWSGLMPPVVIAAYSWLNYKALKIAARKREQWERALRGE